MLKRRARRFHAILAVGEPTMRDIRIHIEQISACGQQRAARPEIEPAHGLDSQFAPARLIGKRRVQVSVGDHDAATFQSRADHLRDMLRPVGGEKQCLRTCRDASIPGSVFCSAVGFLRIPAVKPLSSPISPVGLRNFGNPVQQQLANGLSQGGAARLARNGDRAP